MTMALTSSKPVPEARIYQRVTFSQYIEWDALNFHSMMHYATSAQAARHHMMFGEAESPSFDLGDAAHAAVFIPEIFATKYVAAPNFGNMRTKAAQRERDRFYADNESAGLMITPAKEHAKAVAIRRAIEDHPLASELLITSAGANEVSFAWDEDVAGSPVRCKGRVDRLCQYQGETMICDLKTTKAPWPESFPREVVRYKYRTQISTYRRGLNKLSARNRNGALIAIQNVPPYEIGVFFVRREDMDREAVRFPAWVRKHVECEAAGKWPAANPDGMDLVLSKYAELELGNWTD